MEYRDTSTVNGGGTFQVTFETGPLGINLKSCLSGYGAYIESFYLSGLNQIHDNSIAEQKGLMIGDVLVRIDDVDIEMKELDEIKNLLLKLRVRPITLIIHRSCDIGQGNIVKMILDIRNRLWMKKFLREERTMKSLPTIKIYDEFIKITEFLLCMDDTDVNDQSTTFWWKLMKNEVSVKAILEDHLFHENKNPDLSRMSLLEMKIKLEILQQNHLQQLINLPLIRNYLSSDQHYRKLAFYHRYPDFESISIISAFAFQEQNKRENLFFFYSIYFFSLIFEKSHLMMELFYFRNDENAFKKLFYEKILTELLMNNFLCKFYESELFLYFRKYQLYHQLICPDFISFYMKKLISLPSHFSVHHANYSLTTDPEKEDTTTENIPALSPILTILYYHHDQKDTTCHKFHCEKSLFARMEDPSKHHPDLQEMKKLSARYFLPEFHYLVDRPHSSFTANDSFNLKVRNFRLEGKPSVSTSTQRTPLNQFYCCQLLFPLSSDDNSSDELELKDSSLIISDNDNSLDFINSFDSHLEFVQVRDAISFPSEITMAETPATSVKNSVLESFLSMSAPSKNVSSTATQHQGNNNGRHKRSFSLDLQRSAKDLLNNAVDLFPSSASASSKTMTPFTSISKAHNSSDWDFPVPSPPALTTTATSSSISDHRNSHYQTVSRDDRNDGKGLNLQEGIAINLITRFPVFQSVRSQLLNHYASFLQEFMTLQQKSRVERKKFQAKLLAHSAEFLTTTTPPAPRSGQPEELFSEFHFQIIEEILTFPMIILLFFGTLMEFKIAVVLDDFLVEVENDSLILIILEWIKSCISPLTWEYPALSFLPLPVIEEIIECPTPFFIGMSMNSFHSLLVNEKIIFSGSSSSTVPCGSDTHNISRLLIFHLTTKEIFLPSKEITSSTDRDFQELSFLNHLLNLTEYRCQHPPTSNQLGNNSSLLHLTSFPLLKRMRSIIFPHLTHFQKLSFPLPARSSTTLPSSSSTEESQDELRFPKEVFFINPPATEIRVLGKSKQFTVLLRSFVEQLLSHWHYCSLPIISSSQANIVIEKVLFDEKLFLFLKLQQIAFHSSQSCSSADNEDALPFLLSLPNFTIFMESFLRTQSFSSFLSFHSSSLLIK